MKYNEINVLVSLPMSLIGLSNKRKDLICVTNILCNYVLLANGTPRTASSFVLQIVVHDVTTYMTTNSDKKALLEI